jgi:hypothetical protein
LGVAVKVGIAVGTVVGVAVDVIPPVGVGGTWVTIIVGGAVGGIFVGRAVDV